MDALVEEALTGIVRPGESGAHSSLVERVVSGPDAHLDDLLRRFVEEADESAMEEFVRRTRPRLLGAARGIGHPQDAEDAVQTAYHALLRRGPAPLEAPAIAWLLTAVIRIAYRRKAESARRPDLVRLLAARTEEPDPSAAPVAEEEAAMLRGALDRLPAAYRDALVLHYLHGLPVAAIAALQDAPESTVKARLRRSRALLRSRLPRALLLGLLAVPWAIEDAGSALAGKSAAIAGGIVKAKAAAAAAVIALLASGGGAIWLLRPAAPASPARPGASPSDTAAAADAAGAPAFSHPESPTGTASPPPAPDAAPLRGDSPAPVHRPAPILDGIPEKVRVAAAKLDVPDEALKAAWAAYRAGGTKAGDVPPALLDELRRHGALGFRAVVTLLRSDLNGSWFAELAGATWSPGLESLLIETAEDASLHAWSRWSALDCLGRADAPASRDYLVERLSRETDAGLFFSASKALAALKDPRAAATVASRIEEASWGEAVRSSLMADLAVFDPDMARRVLLQRLADPRSDMVEPTFKVLVRVDPDAARREAEALLDGPRGQSLGPTLVWTLREILGRPQRDPDTR